VDCFSFLSFIVGVCSLVRGIFALLLPIHALCLSQRNLLPLHFFTLFPYMC
jgi:hypothetical protein